MNNKVFIYRYQNYFKLDCDEKGHLLDTDNRKLFNTFGRPVKIHEFINRYLVEKEFNYYKKIWVITKRYVYYCTKRNQLFIHVNFLRFFIIYLKTNDVKFEMIKNNCIKSKQLNLKFNKGFKDKDNQVKPINFLSNLDMYNKALELQTGIGKTYCAIKAMINNIKISFIIKYLVLF